MTHPTPQHLSKALVVIFIGLFLFLPNETVAQSRGRFASQVVRWSVEITPQNPQQLKVVIDTTGIGRSVRNVYYEVNFYSGTNNFLEKRSLRFTAQFETVEPKKYAVFVTNPNPSAARVKGGKIYYTTQQLGTLYSCGIGCRIPEYEYSDSALDIEQLVSRVRDRPQTYPNVLRRPDGKRYPANGYIWVNPSDPNDFRVKLKQGLTRTVDGVFRPDRGYKWVNPGDPADLRVRPAF